jgi:tetratricopeptide (TPR) repeat protein
MSVRASVVGLTLLLALAGCGGESASRPGAVTPAGVDAPPAPSAPSSEGVDESQYGISDDPAAEGAAERPRMNGEAAVAYAAGMKAFRAQDLRGALSQFSKATEADSRAFQAYYSLGVVKERLGDVGGALAAYRQATTIVPDYEPAIAGLSVLLARSGRPDEAVEYLNQRMAAMPKSAAVSAALAEVRSIQGDSGAAQRLAQEALKKRPDYRPAMVTIARDHYRARRLELALYALRGILDGYGVENPARDKDNAEARMMRGMIYKEQGLRGPSLTELKRAVELRPDLVEARVQLATYLLEAGNAPEATALLEGAIRHRPDHILAHLNLGDAYRLLGKPAEARRELEWVLRKDSSIYQVHYNLGLLYLFTDNIPGVTPEQAVDRAIDELEKYKRLRPRKEGVGDDTDELITRAKTKKGLLEAKAEEAKAGAAKPATSGAAKPATTGALKPTTPATPTTPRPAEPPMSGSSGKKP